VGCTEDPKDRPGRLVLSGQPLPPIGIDACPVASSAAPATSGRRLPDIELDCFTVVGQPKRSLRLSLLRGKPMLVNLWAAWCSPCQEEMPAIQRVHRDLGDELLVLGVDIIDSARDARLTIQGTGVSYPSVFDPDDKVRAGLRTGKFQPQTILVNADGEVVDVHIGALDEKEMRALLRDKLGVA
jgi:thiol-disulfide isomerase/thioredoxin